MRQETSFFRKKSVRAALMALTVYGLVFLLPDRVGTVFRGILAPIATPFQGIASWSAFEVRTASSFFASIGNLKRENERLERERLGLFQQEARLRELEHENELLREALKLPNRVGSEKLSAEVISRNVNGIAMDITVNRGTTDRVRVGLPVVVGDGVIIGRVSAVHLTSSEIRLLSHAESTIAARIAGTAIQGVVRGNHGLGLVFDMALSDEVLQPGAPVVTSGLGDALPKELSIGEIREVRPSFDRLFQQAVVAVPVVMGDIRFVSILLTPEP